MQESHSQPLSDEELIHAANVGDVSALQQLFERYQDRLKRMVRFRLDPRIRGRVDPSDVLQEAYIEISQKLQDHVREPKMSFYLWLRLLNVRKFL